MAEMTWSSLWWRLVMLVRVNITQPFRREVEKRCRARRILKLRAAIVSSRGIGATAPDVDAALKEAYRLSRLPEAYQVPGGLELYERDQRGMSTTSVGMRIAQEEELQRQRLIAALGERRYNNEPQGFGFKASFYPGDVTYNPRWSDEGN